MSSFSFRSFIIDGWLVLLAAWLIASVNVKTTRVRQPSVHRVVQFAFVLGAFVLLFHQNYAYSWLKIPLLPTTSAVAVSGCALFVAGVAFAVASRASLGRNWSANVTLKEGHRLVSRGPYKIVRHPIYTGLLTAILGSAIAINELHAFLAIPLAVFGWKLKSLTEERFMEDEFGRDYTSYKQQVKAFIPYVW